MGTNTLQNVSKWSLAHSTVFDWDSLTAKQCLYSRQSLKIVMCNSKKILQVKYGHKYTAECKQKGHSHTLQSLTETVWLLNSAYTLDNP